MEQTRARPILFSGPMVRAILEGKKVMTRRVMKPQPVLLDGEMIGPTGKRIDTAYWHWLDEWWWQDPQASTLALCPYGKPGDSLWVRETYLPDPPMDDTWDYYLYNDGGVSLNLKAIPKRFQSSRHCLYRASWNGGELRWRPSIFMPRWASRITLEITGVKVERVQEITPDDVVKEGWTEDSNWPLSNLYFRSDTSAGVVDFAGLWDSINGKRPGCSWESNPWVWCLSFKRVTK